MSTVRCTATWLLLAALTGAGAQASRADDTPHIASIDVKGLHNLNREYILDTAKLKVGDAISGDILNKAQENLINTGLFGSHFQDDSSKWVVIRADIDRATQQAKVVIEVDENDKIQGINITGSGPIPPAQILPKLTTQVGNVLNTAVLSRDVLTIRTLYNDRGYFAFVDQSVGITNGILNIPIVVGKVHTIKIVGLKKTHPWVITREMKMKTGSYYNLLQLKKDLTAVYNTNLFDKVEPSFIPGDAGNVDITLNITEKRTGNVELAVGYGSSGLIGQAGIGDTNFLGRGEQVNILWEAGGRANRNSFEFNFTEPWVDHKHTSLSLDLFDKAVYRFSQQIGSTGLGGTNTPAGVYYETHLGGQVTVSRPFANTYRGFVGLRYDNVTVPFIPLQVTDQAVLQNGPLATLNLRLTHNTRDFDADPAQGGYEIYTTDFGRANLKPIAHSNGEASSGIFGKLNYSRFGIDARRYISPQGKRVNPKDKRTVYAIRLMAGTSVGTLPFSEQYFVGGAESLRGYNEDRFWGSNMFLASAEFRHPIAQSLTGVVFLDVGDAWGGPYGGVRISGFAQHGTIQPNVGIGLGIRVNTPIGPIRIDEGFGSEGPHTHFSIGHSF